MPVKLHNSGMIAQNQILGKVIMNKFGICADSHIVHNSYINNQESKCLFQRPYIRETMHSALNL